MSSYQLGRPSFMALRLCRSHRWCWSVAGLARIRLASFVRGKCHSNGPWPDGTGTSLAKSNNGEQCDAGDSEPCRGPLDERQKRGQRTEPSDGGDDRSRATRRARGYGHSERGRPRSRLTGRVSGAFCG